MYDSKSLRTKSYYKQRHFTELHSTLTQLQTSRTWDRGEEKKGKHNFITVVMSAEKDLCTGSDPGKHSLPANL